jgi:hypothetical protein
MKKNRSLSIILLMYLVVFQLPAQQINIPRIEAMPNLPEPYIMRNWKQVALGYDSLVFKLDLSGTYLPLTAIYSNTYNFPDQECFYQQTYVGQALAHNESINTMMGIIGATLCGLDKSDQNGVNWVLMMQEFFNWKNGQNIYGNNIGQKTGHDWWYESIPNVLFYQLYSLYPDEGQFAEQFITVADRWLEAVWALGGSTAPWKPPYMNYRAFSLEDMKPLQGGVPEPEAAGALAWIFYQAYSRTGDEKYRIGAELCMEFFSEWPENPAYELQYLYGTILAARMNAEMGTGYDLEKIMNWCFDVGPLRIWAHTLGWGMVVGKWNGMDVSGINAAISKPDNTNWGDYAFLMNSFQQAGILAPVVRYDDRYARAMGKYLLNMANSVRIFYPNYLPPENQDGYEWSLQYDPNSYIAYEALRQYKDGKSPFATGDALAGGWAPTNHSLYSSSPVGYLGGIMETTNVERILKFDLLKTDFFHAPAYPSFLIYNPYNIEKTVELDIGNDPRDIYDAATNTVIRQNVTGTTPVTLPPDMAVVAVLIPAGSEITREGNKTFCQDIVIDYTPETFVPSPLRIKAVAATDTLITVEEENTTIYCTTNSIDPGQLTFEWFDGETPVGNGLDSIVWNIPDEPGVHTIKCKVSENDITLIDSVTIRVVDFINTTPVIDRIIMDPARANPRDTVSLHCLATDVDNQELGYFWTSTAGSFINMNTQQTTWNAPQEPGEYTLYCEVTDTYHATTTDSIIVRVEDLSQYQKGNLIARYPFKGNANDWSGNGNDGTIYNAYYTNVRGGAYEFNGVNSFVMVPSSESLNCNEAITVTFWMKPTRRFDRETYPISHGLWHNRWKVSVGDDVVRWTIRTNDEGNIIITDLDSDTKVKLNEFIQVTATFDGKYSDLFINSEFEGFLHQTGLIEDTDVAMTIGQASPSATANNFQGILDEIRIYDYALSHEDIKQAYLNDLLSFTENRKSEPFKFNLFPNPFNIQTTISFQLEVASVVDIRIFNVMGQLVKVLQSSQQQPGWLRFTWDGSTANGALAAKGIYLCTVRTENAAYSEVLCFQ